jgi:hypothetical protein
VHSSNLSTSVSARCSLIVCLYPVTSPMLDKPRDWNICWMSHRPNRSIPAKRYPCALSFVTNRRQYLAVEECIFLFTPSWPTFCMDAAAGINSADPDAMADTDVEDSDDTPRCTLSTSRLSSSNPDLTLGPNTPGAKIP